MTACCPNHSINSNLFSNIYEKLIIPPGRLDILICRLNPWGRNRGCGFSVSTKEQRMA